MNMLELLPQRTTLGPSCQHIRTCLRAQVYGTSFNVPCIIPYPSFPPSFRVFPARRDAFTMNMLELPQGQGSGFVWVCHGEGRGVKTY